VEENQSKKEFKMKDVYIIRDYKDKYGKEGSEFVKSGIAFDNKDGSINFALYLFPGVKFHIRERSKEEVVPEQKAK